MCTPEVFPETKMTCEDTYEAIACQGSQDAMEAMYAEAGPNQDSDYLDLSPYALATQSANHMDPACTSSDVISEDGSEMARQPSYERLY